MSDTSAQIDSERPAHGAPMLPHRRGVLTFSLLLVVLSLATSVYLTHLHVRTNTDPSFVAACDVNAVFRCTDVAVSRYSTFLRVPVAVWALVGYGAFLWFIVWGYRAGRTWPAGLYWLLSAVTLVVTVTLAVVAETIIRALCIGCLILWATNLLLFISASWMLRNDRGALRRDIGGLLHNRGVLGLAAAGLVASAALVLAYPKYWEVPLQSECEGLAAGVAGDGSCWIGAREPVLEITEFSDYRCPFCRRAHTRMRELVQAYGDRLRLIHKHFPLDTACQPAMQRQLHDGACQMARMAYCAGVQGKFWAMNDRLFSLDHDTTPDAEQLATDTGLNVRKFLDCLDTPAAAEHVRADIQEGLRLHINATPTFVIDGQLYVGQIPEDLITRHLGNRH